jgi:hypothetical protein
MRRSIRVWTCGSFHPAYLCGGWAVVRLNEGQLTGAAGGERRTSARRAALAGLAAGLGDLPSVGEAAVGGPIDIQTTSPELLVFAGYLARLDEGAQADGPEDDLDLWAQIWRVARGRKLILTRAGGETGSVSAFAAAWAELARDKAKAGGAFTAAIPKTNLAKLAELTRRDNAA